MSARARDSMPTRYSPTVRDLVLLAQVLEDLLRGSAFPARHRLESAADTLHRLRTVSELQECLIAPGILDDEFGTAVHCQDQRALGALHAAHVRLRVAEEVGQRMDFGQVDGHRRAPHRISCESYAARGPALRQQEPS